MKFAESHSCTTLNIFLYILMITIVAKKKRLFQPLQKYKNIVIAMLHKNHLTTS